VSSCHEFDALIAEQASGELAPTDRARLDVHLAACPRCQDELAACEGVLELARIREPAPLPDARAAWWRDLDLRRSVLGRLRMRRRRSRIALFGSLSMAAAASFVVAVALHQGPSAHPTRTRAADSSTASWEPDVEGALEASTLGESDSQDDLGSGDTEVAALEVSELP